MNTKTKSVILGIFLTVSNPAFALSVQDQTAVYDSYALEKAGNITKAIEKMVGVLEANPGDYFSNLRLGWLFSLEKKYKNSVDHYERAARASVMSLEPWHGLTLLYLNTGEFAKSLRSTEEVFKRDPKNYFAMQRAVRVFILQKNYNPGLVRVNEALKYYPTDAVFLEQKAYILKEMGKTDEARGVAAMLLLINPANVFARGLASS